jgi:predicted ATPase
MVRDGLRVQQETGHGLWDAELHRFEGIALFGLSRLEEGQVALEEALCIARRQQARAYATSLAGLWRDQGKTVEARELLAPVYGWFTEGFDTRDLKEAKTLLEELQG